MSEEDAAIRDRRNHQIRVAQEKLEFQRRTQAIQKGLPRPSALDIDAMLKNAANISDPIIAAIEREAALLAANDAVKYPVAGSKVKGTAKPLDTFDDDALAQARLQILIEVPQEIAEQAPSTFQAAWNEAHQSSLLPGLSGYVDDDEIDEHQLLVEAFDVRT